MFHAVIPSNIYRKKLYVNDNCGFFFFLFYVLVLSDPDKRLDYDLTGTCEIDKYSLQVCSLTTIKH